ncbi:hypothetical protein BDZ45DRAFT_754704 [Acephala macrosclerotiorum]|nr:hypothetical protein BDZ45DRAFT_754704 [Acephala macrosclerotiorum]
MPSLEVTFGVRIRVRIHLPFEETYAIHILHPTQSGLNGVVFLWQLIHLQSLTYLFFYCLIQFPDSDFPRILGFPLIFGYAYAFGLTISWLGFFYVLCGLVLGRLYLPGNRETFGGLRFYVEVYLPSYALAPGPVECKILWWWVRGVKIIFVMQWRMWKWSKFSTDLWIEPPMDPTPFSSDTLSSLTDIPNVHG